MSTKIGQEKREGLRLDLNQDLTGAAGGLALNTPDLDKACEMALPTPVLNKKVLDMYAPTKAEANVPPQHAEVIQQPVALSAQNPTTVTASTAGSGKPFQQQSYQQPIVIVTMPPSSSRLPVQSSHPRIGQSASSAHVVQPNPLPMAPLDPNEQERLKVDRKRARNREAAQRCREKKIKKIEDLTKDVQSLESQRSSLMEALQHLEQSASQTLQCVEDHRSAGCDLENDNISKLIRDAHDLKNAIAHHISTIDTQTTLSSTYLDGDSTGSGQD